MYNFNGVIRKYYPDFMIRLVNGEYLILETNGVDSQQNQTKREFLNEWVKAVNTHGGFGKWHWEVSFEPSDIAGKIDKITNPAVGLKPSAENLEVLLRGLYKN